MTTQQRVAAAATLINEVMETPALTLGLDLDGTIDENPAFFSLLSHIWPGRIYIITYRDDLTKAKSDLSSYNIKYDDVILVNSFAQKAVEIDRLGIGVYFDDMDEVITHIPTTVTVIKVRNGGNFEDGKWLYSIKTGALV